jgi:hypothetical protein
MKMHLHVIGAIDWLLQPSPLLQEVQDLVVFQTGVGDFAERENLEKKDGVCPDIGFGGVFKGSEGFDAHPSERCFWSFLDG